MTSLIHSWRARAKAKRRRARNPTGAGTAQRKGLGACAAERFRKTLVGTGPQKFSRSRFIWRFVPNFDAYFSSMRGKFPPNFSAAQAPSPDIARRGSFCSFGRNGAICGAYSGRGLAGDGLGGRLGAIETVAGERSRVAAVSAGVARRSGGPGDAFFHDRPLAAGYPAVSRCTRSRNNAWSGQVLDSRTATVRVFRVTTAPIFLCRVRRSIAQRETMRPCLAAALSHRCPRRPRAEVMETACPIRLRLLVNGPDRAAARNRAMTQRTGRRPV